MDPKLQRLQLKLDTFTSILKNIRELSNSSTTKVGCMALRKDFSKIVESMSEQTQDILIPRTPVWTEETTKEELDRAEKDAFLTWRRELAEVEESSGNVFTPFEKNIEFWRQLWRVIERSGEFVDISAK